MIKPVVCAEGSTISPKPDTAERRTDVLNNNTVIMCTFASPVNSSLKLPIHKTIKTNDKRCTSKDVP